MCPGHYLLGMSLGSVPCITLTPTLFVCEAKQLFVVLQYFPPVLYGRLLPPSPLSIFYGNTGEKDLTAQSERAGKYLLFSAVH